MEVRLTIIGGKADRSEVRLKLPFLIGRSREADLTIAHPMVSRKHCEVFELQGMVRVRDLGSLNGIMVLGQSVVESPLRPQDELTVGPLTFRIDYEYPGEATVEVSSGRRGEPSGRDEKAGRGEKFGQVVSQGASQVPSQVSSQGEAIGGSGRSAAVAASLKSTAIRLPDKEPSEVSVVPSAAAPFVSEAPLEMPQEAPAGSVASELSTSPPSLFPETPPPDFGTWGKPTPAASSGNVPRTASYAVVPPAGATPEQLEYAEPIVLELVPEPDVAGHAPPPSASPTAPAASLALTVPLAPLNPPRQPASAPTPTPAPAPAAPAPHDDLDDFLNSLQ